MDFEIQSLEVSSESNYSLERNKPMPSLNHGSIQANLIMELAAYRTKYRISSEQSLDLNRWPSVPDIAIFPKLELDMKQDIIAMEQPPLCTIEILSPKQSLSELSSKADSYFLHGVQSCWIVLPSLSNIYVYSSPTEYEIFRANEVLVDTKLDISFPLAEVFK